MIEERHLRLRIFLKSGWVVLMLKGVVKVGIEQVQTRRRSSLFTIL